jgi:hypothetical protein
MKQINVALAEKLAIARTRQLFERYIYKAPIPAELSKFSTEPPGKTRQCRATNCGRMQRDGRSSSGVEGKIGCHIGRPATPPRHSE